MLRREPADPDALRELVTLSWSGRRSQLSLFSAISTRLNRAYGPILLVLNALLVRQGVQPPRPPPGASRSSWTARTSAPCMAGW